MLASVTAAAFAATTASAQAIEPILQGFSAPVGIHALGDADLLVSNWSGGTVERVGANGTRAEVETGACINVAERKLDQVTGEVGRDLLQSLHDGFPVAAVDGMEPVEANRIAIARFSGMGSILLPFDGAGCG